MNTAERNRRTKSYTRFRTYFDYAMGAFYLAIGLFLLFADKLGIPNAMGVSVKKPWLIALGVLLAAYGIFRIYRGVKQIF